MFTYMVWIWTYIMHLTFFLKRLPNLKSVWGKLVWKTNPSFSFPCYPLLASRELSWLPPAAGRPEEGGPPALPGSRDPRPSRC